MDLERRFEDFLEYVPYLKKDNHSFPGRLRGNERTYSFRLLNLILSIGGHVDSALKEMARYSHLRTEECKRECRMIRRSLREETTVQIFQPINAFESEYGLSRRKILFKRIPHGEEVEPFKHTPSGNNVPEWFTFYNKLKHDVSLNIKKANLRNTRDALAGAFLLNAIHIPSVLRLAEFGLVRSKLTGERLGSMDRKAFEDNLARGRGFWAFIETPSFIYDYEQ